MRDQVLWRKTARIATILAERLDIDAERALNILYNSRTYALLDNPLDIDAERALNILYNSRTYALLDNPDSGLQLMSDSYILNDLLRELEA